MQKHFLILKQIGLQNKKEEWKHAYTNFTNALQEDINNGGGRFSTDEFGTITDTKGEFSNTDSDNYYYNNKGQQISQEDYDALKRESKVNIRLLKLIDNLLPMLIRQVKD